MNNKSPSGVLNFEIVLLHENARTYRDRYRGHENFWKKLNGSKWRTKIAVGNFTNTDKCLKSEVVYDKFKLMRIKNGNKILKNWTFIL